MSAPPVPGLPNLHVALALALGRPAQWTDKQLIADVEARCLPLVARDEEQRYEDVPLPLDLGVVA